MIEAETLLYRSETSNNRYTIRSGVNFYDMCNIVLLKFVVSGFSQSASFCYFPTLTRINIIYNY